MIQHRSIVIALCIGKAVGRNSNARGARARAKFRSCMGSPALRLVRPKNRSDSRREQLREQLWPGIEPQLWNRKREKGFCTLPRTLPLILCLIRELSEKGKDPSNVYLDLWFRAFDDCLIEVNDEEAFAFASGYSSPGRNVRTWKERVDALAKLGFIEVKPNGSKPCGYILMLDPHKVIRTLNTQGRIPASWWGAYTKRATDVGCTLP